MAEMKLQSSNWAALSCWAIPVTPLSFCEVGLQLGSDGVEHGLKQHLGRLRLTFQAGGVALEALVI